MRPIGPGRVAVIAILLVVWAGCRETRSSHRDQKTLVIGRVADAINLDPARATDSESVEITEQIFDKLLSYNHATGEIEAGLATSWTVGEGRRVWTFLLRSGVRFHDGTPLDAAAVEFALERQRDPAHPYHDVAGEAAGFAYWEQSYGNIRRVRAIGPLVVEIELDRPFAPFEADMSMFPVGIVSPSAVRERGADFAKNPIGSGPYRFLDWTDDRIVLERNPNYWGPAPQMEFLVFRTIPDARQRLVALESGAIDIAYQPPPDSLPFIDLHPRLATYLAPVSNVAYLALNTSRSPLSDLRVRKALNHAIDREPIIKIGYQALASPAGGPLPPGHWGYHRATVSYNYDPARARALLAEAAADGVFDPNATFKLYAPSTPRPYIRDPELVAAIVRAQLEDVGFHVELIVQPFSAHIASVRSGQHDLCLHGWVADNADPDNVLYTLFSIESTRGTVRNLAFYRDDVLEELITDARSESDRSLRNALYARSQERIARQAPWVPLAHSTIAVAVSAALDEIEVTATGHVDHRGVTRVE